MVSGLSPPAPMSVLQLEDRLTWRSELRVESAKPRGIGGQTPLPEQLPHDVKSQLVDQFEYEDTSLKVRSTECA